MIPFSSYRGKPLCPHAGRAVFHKAGPPGNRRACLFYTKTSASNPQIVSSKTRYSDNTADFPLQRRITKQEVKKQESERSILFLHPRQTSFRQNCPFHITRFPASKRTSPYVRQASVLADYKSNHDQMLIFFRKQYGRYRNFSVRCMISYDFLKIYSLLINFAADVI